MSWKTVPNIFPDYDDLSDESKYHLREGYGVYGYESKPSGKFYKKIKVDGSGDGAFGHLLWYMGYSEWWNKYKLKKGWFFTKWEIVKTSID